MCGICLEDLDWVLVLRLISKATVSAVAASNPHGNPNKYWNPINPKINTITARAFFLPLMVS